MRRTRAALVAAGLLALAVPAAALADAPVSTSPPTIAGKPVAGQTLVAGHGLWRNTPRSYRYQWLRCDANGNNCAPRTGQTDRRYLVGKSDIGHTLVVLVTARNADGASTANSHPTDVVSPAAAPQVSKTPTITGKAAVGERLVADSGTYAGGAPDSFRFQWQRCDKTGGSCKDVPGATGQTYGVAIADVGSTLRVQVTARNEFGSTTSQSAATDVVTKQPTPVVKVTTTLVASQNQTICCQRVHLTGTVSDGKAGERITVLAREFDAVVDTPIATTTTDASGSWSVIVTPMIQTTYSAQTATTRTPPLTVLVHPRVGFGISGNNFSAKVTARDSFGGAIALFQINNGHGWRTKQLVVINIHSVARFHVNLRRGHRYLVRIFLPKRQAGPGYLGGSSHIRHVSGNS